jgi:hypothetical protein
MKAAKVYEDWEKVSPGSDGYRTVGTEYYAGYANVEEFDALVKRDNRPNKNLLINCLYRFII